MLKQLLLPGLGRRKAILQGAPRLIVFVIAVAFSSSGSGLSIVAVNYYLFEHTHVALSVGLAVLVSFVPPAVLVPMLRPVFLGRRLKRVAFTIPLVQSGTTFLLALWIGVGLGLWAIYVLLTVLGVLVQLSWIAIYSLLPQLRGPVPPVRANAWLHGASQCGVISAMIAASLIGRIEPPTLILYDALSFLGIAAAVAWCTNGIADLQDDDGISEKVKLRHVLRHMAGPQHISSAAWFLAALPLGYVTILVTNATLPVIVLRDAMLGPRGYTLAELSFALGAVVVSALLSHDRAQGRHLLVLSLVGLASGLMMLTLSHRIIFLLVSMMVLGGAVLAVNTTAQNLAQRLVNASLLPSVQSLGSLIGTVVGAAAVLSISLLLQSGYLELGLLAIALGIITVALQVRRKVEALL